LTETENRSLAKLLTLLMSKIQETRSLRYRNLFIFNLVLTFILRIKNTKQQCF